MHYPAKKFVTRCRNVIIKKTIELNSLLDHLLHLYRLSFYQVLILQDFPNNLNEYWSILRANVANVLPTKKEEVLMLATASPAYPKKIRLALNQDTVDCGSHSI